VRRIPVCRVGELPPGNRRIVEDGRLSVGVFNVGGSFFALLNRCPHKAAPLCVGRVTGLVTASEPYDFQVEREGEILKCPWHGWEFDITNGRSVFNPHRVRVKAYDVTVEPPEDEPEDPSVPTFPVSVERGVVVLHLP
jgi:3-phenylpropionate/trans-cinnamate dioxygenase ferredoxin subunit